MTLLLKGDAREVLRAFPDKSVNQFATSPPYWKQRDYGDPGQMGQEKTIEEYLERLWAVFDEGWRVLTPDGTLWVNVGEKYVGNCAQLIPEQFVVGMKARGWLVRNKIIWHKKDCKPESVKSRFTIDWEPLYFFAKSESHYFRQQFEPYAQQTFARCEQFVRNNETFDPSRHKHDPSNSSQAPFRILERIAKRIPKKPPEGMYIDRNVGKGPFYPEGRNMRSVWTLSTARYGGAHFAVWPDELVSRIVRAGCPKGGVVLDPFVGSGTTLVVAEDEGCTGIGIDLIGDYLDLATQRVLEARVKRANPQAVLSPQD
jgi:site-specific DNA-methyltransferase (adenine-specific)